LSKSRPNRREEALPHPFGVGHLRPGQEWGLVFEKRGEKLVAWKDGSCQSYVDSGESDALVELSHLISEKGVVAWTDGAPQNLFEDHGFALVAFLRPQLGWRSEDLLEQVELMAGVAHDYEMKSHAVFAKYIEQGESLVSQRDVARVARFQMSAEGATVATEVLAMAAVEAFVNEALAYAFSLDYQRLEVERRRPPMEKLRKLLENLGIPTNLDWFSVIQSASRLRRETVHAKPAYYEFPIEPGVDPFYPVDGVDRGPHDDGYALSLARAVRACMTDIGALIDHPIEQHFLDWLENAQSRHLER
jgi:hypothetical protein